MTTADFLFRVKFYAERHDESPDIEVWHHDFEPTEKDDPCTFDWIYEAMQNEDFEDRLKLDTSKCWQIIGKGRIKGSFSYDGEYDEEIEILEYHKKEFEFPYMLEGEDMENELNGESQQAKTERMLQWFSYSHLPAHLQNVSAQFHELADFICEQIEPGPERTVALRKLLEAKDAAVRAKLNPGA